MSRRDGICIRGLSKKYGSIDVLKGIDLTIPDGSYTTLLGASGSGKTTLLRIIAGFLKANHGNIYVSGQDITALPPRSRDIGMVFQNYALFPHLTAKQNVEYPLKVRGMSMAECDALAANYLEKVQLTPAANRLPSQLSGGQQQRVALARGLVYQPKLLLLDEPLGALDKNLRLDMQALLRELHRDSQITFIHVTHDQSEALALSTHVVLLRDGRVEQAGAPEEIYHNPTSQFSAEFIGDGNSIVCDVEKIDGTVISFSFPDGKHQTIDFGSIPGGIAVGDRVVILIRHEDMALVESGRNQRGIELSGKVSESTFMGTHYDTVFEGPTGPLVVRTNSRRDTESMVDAWCAASKLKIYPFRA